MRLGPPKEPSPTAASAAASLAAARARYQQQPADGRGARSASVVEKPMISEDPAERRRRQAHIAEMIRRQMEIRANPNVPMDRRFSGNWE